jgi:ABC-type multidrug transport system fused ATPase/permease subunit
LGHRRRQAIEFMGPTLGALAESVESAAPTEPDSTPPHAYRRGAVDIRFCDVHLSYESDPPVLSDLNLHVPAGQTLAVVGPRGAGKTSLARLLLSLVKPDSGRILFDLVPGDWLGPAAVRTLIGVVSQDVMLLDDTIAANVSIGRPQATQADIEVACRAVRIRDFIRSLPAGYDTRVGERGLKLSGGERQRLAIARAILKQPSVYLLDEATSALDVRTEAAIVRDLRRICAGRTTIMITHRLAVARHADRIAVLQDGRIGELGTHRELMDGRGVYATMYSKQTGLETETAAHAAGDDDSC